VNDNYLMLDPLDTAVLNWNAQLPCRRKDGSGDPEERLEPGVVAHEIDHYAQPRRKFEGREMIVEHTQIVEYVAELPYTFAEHMLQVGPAVVVQMTNYPWHTASVHRYLTLVISTKTSLENQQLRATLFYAQIQTEIPVYFHRSDPRQNDWQNGHRNPRKD